MTIEQALELVKQVCEETHTNLNGHQNIQQALQVIAKALEPNDKAVTLGSGPPGSTLGEEKEPDGNN